MNGYTGTENLEIMAAAIKYNNFLMALILNQLHPGIKILDIGAGIGTFANRLNKEGYDVLCFEPDPKQSEFIKANRIPVATSIEEIEISSLDFIYSLNVLEHIDDDVDALKRWYTLLKPGGRMLIYVPAFQLLYSSMDKKVGHFRRYKKNELLTKAKLAGFNIIGAEYADSIGFFASIAYKYLNDGSGDINLRPLIFYDRFLFPISRFLDFILHPIIGKNVFVIVER
jgi:2-polyprenyl-3-methyl-5-hydroxy-6-metoxy-1,4-benzoquinol methylase